MATTPKKNANAAASAGGFQKKKQRSTLAILATILLVASVCGVIAATVVFSGTDDKLSTTISTSNAQERAAAAATVTPPAMKEDDGDDEIDGSCTLQKCKAGGDEVCGTDGKTYLNKCFFKNAQCNDAALKAVKDWKGYNCPNKCKKKIACNEVGKFLCASDGNVYFGYCNLYIAQCLDPSITEIECDKAIFKGVFGS